MNPMHFWTPVSSAIVVRSVGTYIKHIAIVVRSVGTYKAHFLCPHKQLIVLFRIGWWSFVNTCIWVVWYLVIYYIVRIWYEVQGFKCLSVDLSSRQSFQWLLRSSAVQCSFIEHLRWQKTHILYFTSVNLSPKFKCCCFIYREGICLKPCGICILCTSASAGMYVSLVHIFWLVDFNHITFWWGES